jgi:N-acylneuraminate cytidylyltransferase
MSDVLAVTLARGGSKGVPNKHTRLLGGKPVIAWTIEEVLKCRNVDAYIVSSDDDEILDIASEYEGVTPLERPKHLALDTTPTLPALLHAVKYFDKDGMFEYVVEVRATSPFKTHMDIDGAVELLIKSGAESVIGVTELDDHHPMRAKWIDGIGCIRDWIGEPESGRRQDCLPKAYIRNGTIYALRTPIEKLFGHKHSLGYVMPAERSINIDSEMDWLMCEAIERNRHALGS